jgi:hypothetical protein
LAFLRSLREFDRNCEVRPGGDGALFLVVLEDARDELIPFGRRDLAVAGAVVVDAG